MVVTEGWVSCRTSASETLTWLEMLISGDVHQMNSSGWPGRHHTQLGWHGERVGAFGVNPHVGDHLDRSSAHHYTPTLLGDLDSSYAHHYTPTLLRDCMGAATLTPTPPVLLGDCTGAGAQESGCMTVSVLDVLPAAWLQ